MCRDAVIDGSLGEGGGQMLRTALAFSAIAGKSLRFCNIRAGRRKPGLARQHLAGLNLMGKICRAEMTGDHVGSTEIDFNPGRIRHGDYSAEVGTAGAITLVLQTVLPALASVKGQSSITLTGGTDVKWSPPVDYYTLVLFPLLNRMGLKCSLEIERRGYFPRGGGRVVAVIHSPGELESLQLEGFKENITTVGIVNVGRLPGHVAERCGSAVLDHFPEAAVHIQNGKGGPGAGLVLGAHDGQTILGSSSLGEKGKPAEKLAEEACVELKACMKMGVSVDGYASDQLLPFIALGGGGFTAGRLTGHARTNLEIINGFSDNCLEVKVGEMAEFMCHSPAEF